MKAVLVIVPCALLLACRTNVTPEQQVKDLEITAAAKSKLASGLGLSSVPNISVNSTNGVVTLSGQVDTAAAKAKAETIVKSVPNVVRVVNNLQVAAPGQTPTSSRSSPISSATAGTTG
jgi:osmotically-inducible protein OsmY